MQWSRWLLLMAMALLWATSTDASPSNASPRELKALRQALKKQQRLKEQRTAIKGSGEYVPDAGPWTDANEPSCEQLREMWRQSKRHSRAAETTNEIPQYSDPFARAAYARQLAAEPTLRPRPERRPVVYGRLHSSPPVDSDDRAPRPFDVLRKLSRPEGSEGSVSDGGSGVVLYSEDDKSAFPKAPAKGSLQHLRELVREEQAGSGVKGSFQQLRDIVREEGRLPPGRSDWSDADVGRVVTSPSDHSKYSLYATMQGDAPYASSFVSSSHNGRRPTNRLASFAGPKSQQQRNIVRQQTTEDAPRRAQFQLRDPPRPRVGSARLAGSRANRWADASDDVGVVRGYVVGRSNPLYTSKPRRSSSALAKVDDDCVQVDVCRRQSDCRCGQRQRCQRGRCVPAKRNQLKRNSKQSPMDRDEERQDLVENEEKSWSSADESETADQVDSWLDESERPATNRARDLQDIIDALQQIDQQSTD